MQEVSIKPRTPRLPSLAQKVNRVHEYPSITFVQVFKSTLAATSLPGQTPGGIAQIVRLGLWLRNEH